MANFYHVFILPKKGITYEQVETKMNLSVDWFRCTDSVWVLYSTSRIDKWQERLRPLVESGGSLFICRLDISKRKGWMKKEFWDWIKEKEKKLNK
ncbi:hypothetical protein [Desulfotignum balticum]|uniref:hypothetical protein n=1 Tax=Desulfotignum balticum TaxID=115781 RepID=UPI00046297F0|nr:hypothetical protein [Desulfotignum balticum]